MTYLKHSLLPSGRDLNDFLKKAALLKKLSHPSVIQFVGVAIETAENQDDDSKPKGLGRKALEEVKSMLTMKRHSMLLDLNHHSRSSQMLNPTNLTLKQNWNRRWDGMRNCWLS